MSGIALIPADNGGCGFYRIMQPAEKYAEMTDSPVLLVEAGQELPKYPAWDTVNRKFGCDFALTSRPTENHQSAYWRWFKSVFPHIPLYMDFDDLLWNPCPRSNYKPTPQNIANIDAVARLSDRLVCSTKPMQDALWRRYKKKAVILPNMISRSEFIAPHAREADEKLRVFWGGSATHQSDLDQIIPVVQQTSDRYDWHFMGWVPDEIKQYVTYHDGVKREDYLPFLRSLNVHVGVAPLADTPFNKCKSNIKLLEYGALGIATVANAVYPYNKSPCHKIPTGEKQEWLSALVCMEDEVARMKNAEASQSYARLFLLEENGELIRNAYT